jgi:hypothetical protein
VHRRSDNAKLPFAIKGAIEHLIVRTRVENREGPNAFQAYDEGSIPFTRSNSLDASGLAASASRLAPLVIGKSVA